jgi:arylsulfatase A-like enzyme
VSLYFEQADDITHWYGVGSPESVAAIGQTDRLIGELLDGLDALPHGGQVYVVVVSDHGQGAYDDTRQPLVLADIVDLAGTRIVEGGPFAFIYFEKDDPVRQAAMRDVINRQWDCGRALLRGDAPTAWNLHGSTRFADLLVQADPGCGVVSTREKLGKITPGDHGWSPESPNMRGIFLVRGPRIPGGVRLPAMTVMDVQPLLISILGLSPPGPIDGDPDWPETLLLAEPN